MDNADVAQLVEHNLAKVGVAGSNPVVRSRKLQVGGHIADGQPLRSLPSYTISTGQRATTGGVMEWVHGDLAARAE